MVDGLLVFGIESVSEIVSFFKCEIRLTPHTYTEIEKEEELLDFRDVKGQGRQNVPWKLPPQGDTIF